MSLFVDTWQKAASEGSARGLSHDKLAGHIRASVEAACGPLPIKVNAGYVTDISYLTDGRPIMGLNV